jgi:hypothetical protein
LAGAPADRLDGLAQGAAGAVVARALQQEDVVIVKDWVEERRFRRNPLVEAVRGREQRRRGSSHRTIAYGALTVH